MRKIKEIILHCSETPEGKEFKASDIDRWHKEKGWKCIGYHFVIDLDGKIEEGRPVEMIGSHAKGHNSNSIGICYIGGTEKDNLKVPKDTRTDAQKESMFALVFLLLQQYNLTIDDVYGHYQFSDKACPSFSIETFKEEYNNWLNN